MSDQAVQIVDYDPRWPDLFDLQRGPVTAALAAWLAGPLEHIGSTSVPGLAAKPVIDMLAPVESLGEAQAAVPALEADGWWFWPDDPCRNYRLWFLRPRPDARTHHLHVIAYEDPHARALLAFRDALRLDPLRRDDYAALKRALAREHPDNRNAYTNAKADFVEATLRAAGVTLPNRDPLPE
jgi:GrpB-like predicted nucleotidyltransferase (UPF0157 family)